jgi:hypothetical protein
MLAPLELVNPTQENEKRGRVAFQKKEILGLFFVAARYV